MKAIFPLTATAMMLALTACGSEGESDKSTTSEAAPATESAASTDASGMVEKAKEAATKVAEALKLDTSSMDSFKSSLSDMKASLSGDQASQLTSALTSLAKGSAEEKGGLLGAAKSVASGKSMEETLYETVGDKLNGLTFEDILKLAS